jgi:predicted phosphodiesterase
VEKMKIHRLRTHIIACLSILLFCSAAYSWNEIATGPYLQNVGKDHITIMWETAFSTKSRVDYGITKDCSLFVEDTKEARLHEVTLCPLRPNTLYYYEISCDFTTKTGSFKTAPNHNIPFKFVVYGDTQANPDIHKKIAEKILQINPDLILHTGDIVSNGTKNYQWTSLFFDPLRNVIDHIPIFTCLGNHERNAQNYFDFFSLPNNESWYSFNYSNCHFIVLDTNKDYGKNSQQYKWLKDDLLKTDTKWKFAFFHHPPYTSGRHPSNLKVRALLTPLFRKHGVDIVFSGHNHLYERSYPINSAFTQDDSAVTYVVSGGGGGTLYDFSPNNIWTASVSKAHNFCVVNVDGASLDFKALDTDGQVLDKFTILKENGKYQQYVKNAIPCEKIEFEGAFPTNITSPVVLLEKSNTLAQGAVEIQNPFPDALNVKIVWYHLNDWDVTPEQTTIKIDGKKVERIPFTFHSPKDIWPTPKFLVVYDIGSVSGKVTNNNLKVLLSRELSCKKTDTSIELDGRLKEHFWTDASPANKFIRTDGSELAKKQTIAKVAPGKDAIYFAFVCNESAPKKLSANVDRRDGDIRNDEAVIVSIAPHNEDEMVYQFGVNCEGIEYDSKGGRKEWNGKWKSKIRINDENWTVEMAIPYSVLELPSPPKRGETWRINFFRSTMEPAEESEWSTTLNSPLKVERLGVLRLN